MARVARPTEAGIYHVVTRAVDGQKLARDVEDYYYLSAALARTLVFERWRCLAACFLTTHYHLIVEAGEGALPQAMKHLNGDYARSFNRRHVRRGHLVDGRYLAVAVTDTEQLLATFRYVAMNPVEAGLCAEPAAWSWSSYAAAIGLVETFAYVDPSPVLELFSADRAQAQAELRAFVEGV